MLSADIYVLLLSIPFMIATEIKNDMPIPNVPKIESSTIQSIPSSISPFMFLYSGAIIQYH